VPYNETRNYVKNVLAFTAVYSYRLETTMRRLAERMPRVPSTAAGDTDPDTTP